MMTYEACQDELIMFSYLCGTVFVASLCLITGDLKEGMVFLHHKVSRDRSIWKRWTRLQ